MNKCGENVLHGEPLVDNITDGADSLAEFVFNRLTRQQDVVSLIDGISGAQITSQQLLTEALRVTHALRSSGVTDTDKVALFSDNRLEIAAAIFGTLLLGATLVPINPTYTARELLHAVHLARPKVVFTSANSVAAVQTVLARSAFIQTVVALDEVPPRAVRTIAYADFVGDRTYGSQYRCKVQGIGEKVAIILFSSGTTGLPKGVELTEKNVLATIAQYNKYSDAEERQHAPEPILLTVSPWSHTFGCLSLIIQAVGQTRIIFWSKFVADDYLAAIQRYRPNTANVVPPLMVLLAKHPSVDRYDLSSLKVIVCGAAPLSKDVLQAVRNRLGVPVIRQGYGMTEATLSLTRQANQFSKTGSVGVLRPGISGRVVDLETGSNLPAYQRGELHFAGPTIMKGYIGDQAATEATIDADGWLHTGDIGYYDADGELFIVDRLKELIKYNGFQVPPAEIEGILLQHPLISDAGVVGVPDERVGEKPLAFVVRQANGGALTKQEVLDFVAERVSKAKRLHGGVRFVAVIPKNPSGKILRRELRQLLNTVKSKI